MKNKKILDLTIDEFKDTIREVVTEEMAKYNFISPTYIPTPQPYYCPCQPNPYQQQQVWATTNTVEDEEMLKKRQKYFFKTISKYENKIRGDING